MLDMKPQTSAHENEMLLLAQEIQNEASRLSCLLKRVDLVMDETTPSEADRRRLDNCWVAQLDLKELGKDLSEAARTM